MTISRRAVIVRCMPASDLPTVQPPRSILVGVELHDSGGEAVIAAACAYAAALGAELILAGAAPLAEPLLATGSADLAPPMMAVPGQQEMLDRLTRERLAEVAAGLPAGVPCRTVLMWGPLGPALVEAAKTEGADLIALPIRREGPIGHLIHDGADRYVLHHSRVPVLIVPA